MLRWGGGDNDTSQQIDNDSTDNRVNNKLNNLPPSNRDMPLIAEVEKVSNNTDNEISILKDMVVHQQDQLSLLKNRVGVMEKVCITFAKIDDGRMLLNKEELIHNLVNSKYDIVLKELCGHMKSTEEQFTYFPTSQRLEIRRE